MCNSASNEEALDNKITLLIAKNKIHKLCQNKSHFIQHTYTTEQRYDYNLFFNFEFSMPTGNQTNTDKLNDITNTQGSNMIILT